MKYASLKVLVLVVATGSLIEQISTMAGSVASPNALASPTLVDIDADGDVDYAYAGDLLAVSGCTLAENIISVWIQVITKPPQCFTTCNMYMQ